MEPSFRPLILVLVLSTTGLIHLQPSLTCASSSTIPQYISVIHHLLLQCVNDPQIYPPPPSHRIFRFPASHMPSKLVSPDGWREDGVAGEERDVEFVRFSIPLAAQMWVGDGG